MQWKPIIETYGAYSISSNGVARSELRQGINSNGKKFTVRQKYLKPYIVSSNYYMVALRINGQTVRRYIHRLVAIEHVLNPDPETYKYVDHINGKKRDNRAENLRWCTQKQNLKFARNGKAKKK